MSINRKAICYGFATECRKFYFFLWGGASPKRLGTLVKSNTYCLI